MLSKTSRVISSKARNLANVQGKRIMLSSSAGSLGASLCRDDTNAEFLVLVDNCYIITMFFDCNRTKDIRQLIYALSPDGRK